jgi:hypothetical protein
MLGRNSYMRKHLIILLLFSILSICCKKTFKDTQGSSVSTIKDSIKSDSPKMAFYKLDSLESWVVQNYDQPLSSILSTYGQPISINYDTVRNVHDECLDSIVSVNYSAIIIKLYHVSVDGRYLFFGASIKGQDMFTKLGFIKGMTRDSLVNMIHQSYESYDDKTSQEKVLRYTLSNDLAESYFDFAFVEGRLSRIDYIPYTD